MSTPTLIGVPAYRGTYVARLLQFGEHPEILVPLLRRIWTGTFGRDTHAMTAALLARAWWTLSTNPKPRRWDPQPPVPGLGYPADDGTIWRGSLREDIGGSLEWLYLLHADQRRLVVYEATVHGRWLRHSAHHLDPAEELFVAAPAPDADDDGRQGTVCTVCGAIDEIDHIEAPSMAGYGSDTTTTCTRCGSTVASNPIFGERFVRKPWPPHTPTPGAE